MKVLNSVSLTSLISSIISTLLGMFTYLSSAVSSLLFPGRQNLTPFHCDFCTERFAGPQELVDHLWEEHGYPAEVSINGRVYRSGPSEVLDRYFLQRWAAFRNSR